VCKRTAGEKGVSGFRIKEENVVYIATLVFMTLHKKKEYGRSE
jgi:hypothetical protein